MKCVAALALTLALWPLWNAPPPSVTEVPVKGAKLFLFTFKRILLSFTSKRHPPSLAPSFHHLLPAARPILLPLFFFFLCPWPPLSPPLSPFRLHSFSLSRSVMKSAIGARALKRLRKSFVRLGSPHVPTCRCQICSDQPDGGVKGPNVAT